MRPDSESPLEQAVSGVLEADVDLLLIASRERESLAANPVESFLHASDEDLTHFQECGEEPILREEELERVYRKISQPTRRAVATRRKILGTLIGETQGKGKLMALGLDRGWNFESLGVIDTFMEIILDALREWLRKEGSKDVLRQVRRSDEFVSARRSEFCRKARELIIDRTIEKLGIDLKDS